VNCIVRYNNHYFSLEQQPKESEYLRKAIKEAEQFPEGLYVGNLKEGEWRKLIPLIEQNHNLQDLTMNCKFSKEEGNNYEQIVSWVMKELQV